MQRIVLPSGKEVELDTATEDHTGIASELQPRSAPVIKTSEPKVARSKAVSGDRRTKRKVKTKNSPSPQKSRLVTKQQTGLGMPRSHTLSNTFSSTPDFVTPSNSNMATPADSQKQYSALLSVSSSASSEEEDFPLITSSVPQVPPPQMLMEDMMDGRSHLEALEQIFASDSESEVDEGEEEGGSTMKAAATGGLILCTLSSVCLYSVFACTQLRMFAIRSVHTQYPTLMHFYCRSPLSQRCSVNFMIDGLAHFHCRVCKIEYGALQLKSLQ